MFLLAPLYNKPNHIVEKQKIYQNDARKVMYRLPRSQIYLGVFGATFTVGMLASLYGAFSLLRGKPSKE